MQEATPKTRDKLTSLGQHCARQGLKMDYFERLAINMDALVNVLSEAKQAGMSRPRGNATEIKLEFFIDLKRRKALGLTIRPRSWCGQTGLSSRS